MPQTPSTRWCPTPEQLMILEEMYRSGVRTPNAAEIQQITAHLAYYGRIEGKNIFYWFQNHKARERQRLRRRLCARHQQQYLPASSHPPAISNTLPSSPVGGGGSGGAGVHPPAPAMVHPSYATSFIMPQQAHHHLGYLGQQTAALPVVQHHPAAAPATGGGGGGNKQTMATSVAALYNSSQQQEWTEPNCCSASPGSSDNGGLQLQLPPCCRRPLKTLDLFPIKTSTGGLKDECSSSKSSSCSTSTT